MSVFVPRGLWLWLMVLWAVGLALLFLIGAFGVSRALAMEDCATASAAACFGERQAYWMVALIKMCALAWLLVAVVGPILVHAAARGGANLVRRRLRPLR